MDRLRPEHLRQWLKSLGIPNAGEKHRGGQSARGASRKRKTGKAVEEAPKPTKPDPAPSPEAFSEHAPPAAGRVYYCRWLAAE
jgi:hypothetical protein